MGGVKNKSKYGMYLGWQGLTIVEQIHKKINNSVYIPYISSVNEPVNITQILSNSIKFAALVGEGLRKLGIEGALIDCGVSLTQRDILVRFFSMPYLSVSEIDKALSFEIRKYIPFKLQELQYISQRFRKADDRKIDILWIGIKDVTYKQYVSMLEEANIKISMLEPASMSIVRILSNKTNIKNENIAVIDVSSLESNITILHNGIPVFTREVRFSSAIKSKEQEAELTRLGNDFRMAFDFYRRQYSLGEISRILLVSDIELNSVFEEISKEIGITLDSYRPANLIESKVENIGVDALKAVSVSLKGTIKTNFHSNLYKKEGAEGILSFLGLKDKLPISKTALIKTSVICASVIICMFIFSYVRSSTLKRELASLVNVNKESKITKKYDGFSADMLKEEKEKLVMAFNSSEGLTKKDVFSSEKLSLLAKIMPKGIWLHSFLYKHKDLQAAEIKLEGFAYKGNEIDDNIAVDSFVTSLKNNAEFAEGFHIIQLDARSRRKIGEYETEQFYITCMPLEKP